MKILPLSSGHVALIDDEYFDSASKYKWSYHVKGYAFRGFGPRKKRQYQYLHRFIMGEPDTCGQQRLIDHINGDKLDNRRENLRLTTRSANAHNRPKEKSDGSGRIGVYWIASKSKWCARITVQTRRYHLGYFDDLNAAIAVRQGAEIELCVVNPK